MKRPKASDILFPLCRGIAILGCGIGLVLPIDLNVALPPYARILLYVLLALIALCGLRDIAIGAVRIYQAKAKESTRAQCRFEPTCSEYMILALQKYGLIAGLILGIRRISRCHPPNGGTDYP